MRDGCFGACGGYPTRLGEQVPAERWGRAGGALQALNVLDADSWIAFNSGMGGLLLGAGGALLARRAHPVSSVQLYRRGPAFAD